MHSRDILTQIPSANDMRFEIIHPSRPQRRSSPPAPTELNHSRWPPPMTHPPVTHPPVTHPPSPASAPAIAACEERDDGAAHGDDGADDGVQDGSYAADDGHDAITECAERACDLWFVSLCSRHSAPERNWVVAGLQHTQETTAPIVIKLDLDLGGLWYMVSLWFGVL